MSFLNNAQLFAIFFIELKNLVSESERFLQFFLSSPNCAFTFTHPFLCILFGATMTSVVISFVIKFFMNLYCYNSCQKIAKRIIPARYFNEVALCNSFEFQKRVIMGRNCLNSQATKWRRKK